MKVLELFAGIGACSKALTRLGIEHEIVDAVEIDKYAMASFNAIHGTNFDVQDICEWDKDVEVDLLMHGSPCQDFSLAGRQAGGDIGSGTRSSLMYETIRIVGKLRPKYVIWENVKNVLSAKHRHNFENYLTAMSSLGYTNHYEVLNAKDYGIPQNRERVFVVSILNGGNFDFPKERIEECEVINPLKDISGKSWQFEQNVYSENSILRSLKAGGGSGNIPKVIEHFEFPTKQPLQLRLKDMLEDVVDEKYYLSDDQVAKIKNSNFMQARDWKDPKCVQVGELDIKGLDCIKRVYSDEGLSPTLTDMQGGNRQPKVLIKNATKKGYQEAFEGDSVNLAYPDSTTRRGRVGNQVAQTLQCNDNMGVVVNGMTLKSKCKRLKALVEKTNFEEGKVLNLDLYNQTTNENLSQCLTEPHHNSQRVFDGLRIRKLTPKECWRLMGFDDTDFEKAEKVNSNTQLYKQAGNSIVVNVLEVIFKNLL